MKKKKKRKKTRKPKKNNAQCIYIPHASRDIGRRGFALPQLGRHSWRVVRPGAGAIGMRVGVPVVIMGGMAKHVVVSGRHFIRQPRRRRCSAEGGRRDRVPRVGVEAVVVLCRLQAKGGLFGYVVWAVAVGDGHARQRCEGVGAMQRGLDDDVGLPLGDGSPRDVEALRVWRGLRSRWLLRRDQGLGHGRLRRIRLGAGLRCH